MNLPCPTCSQPAAQVKSNRNRPFCSEKCRLVDLGKWLNEEYVVPGAPTYQLDPALTGSHSGPVGNDNN